MKICVVGDIMYENKEEVSKAVQDGHIFDQTTSYFKKFDYIVGNLETPIGIQESIYKRNQYRFCAPANILKILKENNFKLLLTANNHCLDQGIDGLNETIKIIKDYGFDQTGTVQNKKEKKYIIKEIDQIKIGFINFTYGTNAFSNHVYLKSKERFHINLFQKQELYNPIVRFIYTDGCILVRIVRKILKSLKIGQFSKPIYERIESRFFERLNYFRTIKECKLDGAEVIVSCLHIGGQYNELPLKYTQKICKESIKYGADIVIANHEHVIHPIKKLDEKKIIVYSLGNFFSIAGVLQEPYDVYANFSIAFHIHLDRMKKDDIKIQYSFTIFSTQENYNKNIELRTLYDLYRQSETEEEKSKYSLVNNFLLNRIFQTEKEDYKMQEEYYI